MPKPFIAKKDKQVISSFTSSWRDRTGREKFPDKSEINTKPHQEGSESGSDYEGEDDEYYEDEEYYEGSEGQEYTDEEYSSDEEEHNKFSKKEDDLSMIGFKKDGFDYSKYMKPIGGGVFIPAVYDVNDLKKTKGNVVELVKNSEPAPFMYGLEEISKDYKKDVKDLEVDDDIKQALVIDDEEDDFEDLDDDFILQANGGTLDGLQEEVDDTINKFKNFKIKNRNYDFDDDEEDDAEYYYGDEDDEEYEEVIKGKSRGETRRAQDEGLEAQFEIALEQYEEEDIGELEPEDTMGACDVNNFNDVFDEFIEDYNKNHESLSTQIEILKRDNGFIALTDREKELILNRDWNKEVLVEVSDHEDEENEEDKWDCETILTTYTNLDNHPKLLREEKPRKIVLSAKTGLPVKSSTTTVNHNKQTAADDDSDDDSEDDDSKPTNQGVSRKNESKELRKLRKQQLKEDRKNKRELKKDLKVAFKKEEIKQTSIIKDQKTNQSITVRY